jgi:hypothetical protein
MMMAVGQLVRVAQGERSPPTEQDLGIQAADNERPNSRGY